MGRQGGDPTMVNSSSIALLQERFIQLQKVRERREEKELLRLFSKSEVRSIPTMPNNRFNFQPQYQDSALCLGLNSLSWQTDFRAMENQAASTAILQPNNNTSSSATSRNFDNSDLDTSLHL